MQPAASSTGRPSRGLLLRSTGARDLALVGGVALLLRVAWVLVYGRSQDGPNDALFYEIAAGNLSDGRGYTTLFGDATAHWPPGFPFLVSLAYRVFGTHVELGLALNVVLGTATAMLLYLVGRRMLGRSGGMVAGAGFAVLPAPIFFTGLFMPETTYMFMLVGFLALALFMPDRRWTPVALGVAAGLAALTKGEAILLPLIPLAMWWSGPPLRPWAGRAALLLVAMALTVAPWTIRNLVAMDSFIPVATNASTTLWSGHNPNANGGPTYAPPELLDRIPKGISATQHEVEEAGLLRREAVRWAIRNPHKELGLIPRKLISLGNATSRVFPIWFNEGEHRELGTSSLLVFGTLGDGLDYLLILLTLAALVLIGGRRLWRSQPAMRGVLAYLAGCLVIYGFVYYGQFRYRLPMEPLMLLVAAPLVVTVWERRRELRGGLAP